MPLPGTLSGVTLEVDFGFAGPIKDGNDNYYAFFRNSVTLSDVSVMKSTDGGINWSEVDSVNRPSSPTSLNSIGIFQDGTAVHIATADTGGDLEYHRFNTSDAGSNPDTWQETDTSVDSSAGVDHIACSIVVRSDGDRIIFYQDAEETLKGTAYGRVSYALWEGVSWSAGNAVDDGGSVDFAAAAVSVLGASDKTHFFYKDDTNNQIYHKSLTSGNSLSAAERVDDNGTDANQYIMPNAVYYDAAGTERVTVAWVDNTNTKAYTSEIDNDGTPGAEEAASDNTVSTAAVEPSVLFLAVDTATDTVYLVYANAADNDLYIDSNANSGGWGTDTEILDAVSVTEINANIYVRANGDTVLAYVYNDGGTVKYNEYVIVAAGAGFSWPSKLRHPSTNVLLRL